MALGTSFKVNVSPSSEKSQLSARYGCGFQFSSNLKGLAKIWVEGKAVAEPDWTAPLKCLNTASVPNTSVPLVCSAADRPAAAPNKITAEIIMVGKKAFMNLVINYS
jgi:hypothetical protein